MDTESLHIGGLLRWVQAFLADPLNGVENGSRAQIAICFCGPPPVAHLIASAAKTVNAKMEFAAESQ